MKRIEAIIRPHKLEAVLQALSDAGATGVTVLETMGFGRQMGHSDVFQGDERPVGVVPKKMLIVYAADDKADELVRCLADTARTGQIGDGKISVSELTDMFRIRTGEQGEIAL